MIKSKNYVAMFRSSPPGNQYHIGWISAVQIEYAIACAFLDEVYETPGLSESDQNVYTCGRVARHNVVIACLPQGKYGLTSATSVIRDLHWSFPTIRYCLMVGIGGGAPLKRDVRLGDVVVGCPTNDCSGVIHYQFGKNIQGQSLKLTGSLNSPPRILLAAINKLGATHMREGNRLRDWIESALNEHPPLRRVCRWPGIDQDRLYVSSYVHPSGANSCDASCPKSGPSLIYRVPRQAGDEIHIHHGIIASADQLMKDAISRDKLSDVKDVICFEMEAAGIVDHIPCLVIRGICDYSDTHKNDEWQGFAAATAAAYARELLGILPAVAPTAQPQSTFSNRQYRVTRVALFRRLFCLDYENLLANVAQATAGTGKWLTEHHDYQDWLDCRQASLLYLRGPPGYGKSVTAADVVRRWRKGKENSQRGGASLDCDIVQYFFVNSVAASLDKVTFLRSFLHQILLQRPQLADTIDDALDTVGLEDRRSVERPHKRPEALWKALHIALSEEAPPTTLVVIDAIDEANGEDAIDIVNGLLKLSSLLQRARSGTNLKVMLTSRFDSSIYEFLKGESSTSHGFAKILFIEMRQEEMSADIKIFLDSTVSNFGSKNGFSSSVITDIMNAILRGADGMFLWAQLAWNEFTKDVVMWSARTVRNRLEELHKLPKGVESLYDTIISRINTSIRPQILSLIDYVLSAYRPLHHEELAVFVGILGDETSTKDIDTPFSLERIIKNHCSSLLKMDAKGTIQVIHLSLKEFLLNQEGNKAQSLECKMARTCIHYLNLSDLRKAAETNDIKDKCIMQDTQFVGYRYAAEYLSQHMNNVPSNHSLWLRFARMVENDKYYHIAATSDHFIHKLSRQRRTGEPSFSVATPLRIALKLKNLDLIDRLASVGYNMNERWTQLGARHELPTYGVSDQYNAIHAYIRNAPIIAKLLQCGASPNIPDSYLGFDRYVPLQLAILSKEPETVQVLLESPNIDVNFQDAEGKTALHYDTNSPHASPILSDARVDFGVTDNNDRTALTYAIYWGNEVAAARMIKFSSRTLAHVRRNLSPVVSAAKLDWKGLTELMLDQVDDLSIHRGLDGKTVLHHAVMNGWVDMVKEICARGPIVNIRDNRGKTALHCAAELGQYQMVRQLIRLGASARIKDRLGRTAVHAAAVEGYADTILPLILESDYDVNATDGQRRSTLHWAATCDYARIIEVVVGAPEVNLSLRDFYGRTALHVAALCGCPSVIRELIDLDHYEISQTDAFGNTLLHLAARSGSVTVLEMLLPKLHFHKHRVNNWGQTALSIAVAYRASPTVRYLLESNGVRYEAPRQREVEKSYYTRRGGWESLQSTEHNTVALPREAGEKEDERSRSRGAERRVKMVPRTERSQPPKWSNF